MSDDDSGERVCPVCGVTRSWGEEYSACEDCDPKGLTDSGAPAAAELSRLRGELAEAVRLLRLTHDRGAVNCAACAFVAAHSTTPDERSAGPVAPTRGDGT